MPAFSRELTVSARIADLPEILAFVETASKQADVDPALHFDLQLAIEEACANVIEHAYACKGGDLTITFETHGRDVVITLRDHGRPFAPEAVVSPNLELPLTERRSGGLGMHLMYQLMDGVQYDFARGTNTLVMVKRNAVSLSPVDVDA